MTTAYIECEDLTISTSSGQTLVRDVALSIERGTTFGIVGESGSGKSLTCRALIGALPPGLSVRSGRVSHDGVDYTHAPESAWRRLWGRRIGTVFQDPGSYLNPSIPIGKQIEEPLRFVGRLSRPAARERTRELIRDVGLRDPDRVARQYPFELSGGMLQRILIAIAICNDPELLVADEATTALDVTVQAEILDLLTSLRQERGLTTIAVSHDLGVIAQLCERVAVFHQGRIVEQGTLAEVLIDPRHPYTRSLVDSHARFGLNRLSAEGVV